MMADLASASDGLVEREGFWKRAKAGARTMLNSKTSLNHFWNALGCGELGALRWRTKSVVRSGHPMSMNYVFSIHLQVI
jgi:hypothetical protein